jgi:alkylated DNA repair protein (DNA oxidative demethylase)
MPDTPSESLPPGFFFKNDFLTDAEVNVYEHAFAAMSFATFSMRGHRLRRQVRAFGMGFGMNFRSLHPAEPMPPFLLRLRDRATRVLRIKSNPFEQALVQRYPVGSAIGFHIDDPVFGSPIIGVSFGGSARLRLRRPHGDQLPVAVHLAPGCLYAFRGTVRTEWLHSVDSIRNLRYSVTFRSLRARQRASISSR